MSSWAVAAHRGSAADLHALEFPDPVVPQVWWMDVVRPAVVLGSAQRDEVVDREAAGRLGLDVVRRRSGGGAVLLVPGEVTWVDVLLPAGHPRWEVDVGRASWWLGRAWREALRELGVPGRLAVHEGGLVRSPWSDLVCFGGLGAGEVTVDGQKVIGISQRRTRAGARFQCLLLHRWDPTSLLQALSLDGLARRRAASALAEVGGGVGPLDPGALQGSLLRALDAPD